MRLCLAAYNIDGEGGAGVYLTRVGIDIKTKENWH